MRRELVTGCTVRRYEQLEVSPETIEQELRPAVCERRQKDRQTDLKENYSIDARSSSRHQCISISRSLLVSLVSQQA